MDPEEDQELVATFPIKFSKSEENTENKSPEYGKVWEDGKLVVTAIFGKNEEGETSSWDAGISAYNRMYNALLSEFGEPVNENPVPDGRNPGVDYPDLELEFTSSAGPVFVNLSLVDGIRSVDADFITTYNERTKRSDFISYSGHSGLGANIRALARMGEFVAGQYQVFLVNGCDTFAYVDDAIG